MERRYTPQQLDILSTPRDHSEAWEDVLTNEDLDATWQSAIERAQEAHEDPSALKDAKPTLELINELAIKGEFITPGEINQRFEGGLKAFQERHGITDEPEPTPTKNLPKKIKKTLGQQILESTTLWIEAYGAKTPVNALTVHEASKHIDLINVSFIRRLGGLAAFQEQVTKQHQDKLLARIKKEPSVTKNVRNRGPRVAESYVQHKTAIVSAEYGDIAPAAGTSRTKSLKHPKKK